MRIQAFTFGPFQENTYVLSDDTRQCVIIDPGCSDAAEEAALHHYVVLEQLQPAALLCTHCHIDHVMGNAYVHRTWGLQPWLHRDEQKLLAALPQQAMMFGVQAAASPPAAGYLVPGEQFRFGNTLLDMLHAPGHSPGSICFYHTPSGTVIAGDVLFAGSIGRTDLPGGNYETLMRSIYQVLLALPDATQVLPGHGPATTIGAERRHNPFLQ